MREGGYWSEQINDILAEAHPVEIEEHIIKPAIQQVIEDLVDSMNHEYPKGIEEQILEQNKQSIEFWKTIQKQIEKKQ